MIRFPKVRRPGVVKPLVAVALGIAVLSIGLVRTDTANAVPSTYNIGCTTSMKYDTWTEGCFGVDNSHFFPETHVTIWFQDTKSDGHYVKVQRNLSWVNDAG